MAVDAFIVIVNRYRENFFGPILAHDPFIQLLINFFRGKNMARLKLRRLSRRRIFLQNVSTQVHALIADKYLVRPGNETVNFVLGPLAE
jgi:hypothetical protein